MSENDGFTKTGSGQTEETLREKRWFVQGAIEMPEVVAKLREIGDYVMMNSHSSAAAAAQ